MPKYRKVLLVGVLFLATLPLVALAVLIWSIVFGESDQEIPLGIRQAAHSDDEPFPKALPALHEVADQNVED